MKKNILGIVLLIILVIMLVITTNKLSNKYSIINTSDVTAELTYKVDSVMEYAYFEGQKDAINNKIRIKLDSDSIYKWSKSPWDNGRMPIFRPTKKGSQNCLTIKFVRIHLDVSLYRLIY